MVSMMNTRRLVPLADCLMRSHVSVMVFRAVSAPMLKSEPGTLLETVAGTITMGTQNSSYLSRAADSSSRPK